MQCFQKSLHSIFLNHLFSLSCPLNRLFWVPHTPVPLAYQLVLYYAGILSHPGLPVVLHQEFLLSSSSFILQSWNLPHTTTAVTRGMELHLLRLPFVIGFKDRSSNQLIPYQQLLCSQRPIVGWLLRSLAPVLRNLPQQLLLWAFIALLAYGQLVTLI